MTDINETRGVRRARELYNKVFDEGSAILENRYATDLSKVLSNLNIRAYRTTMSSFIAEFNEKNSIKLPSNDIIGLMFRTIDDNIIFVDKEHSLFLQRYTIAFVIGEEMLSEEEQEEKTENGVRIIRVNEFEEETAKKEFAEELLMPKFLVKYVFEQTQSAIETAAVFAVSKQAMMERLNKMGVSVYE